MSMITKKNSSTLRREQLDSLFASVRRISLPARPKRGWVREIRECLGMKRPVLAEKLSIDTSTLARLEKSEEKMTATLKSLKRMAEALECNLYYVLVPKKSLSKTLEEKAAQLLESDEDNVEHSMLLEGQAVGKKKSAQRRAIEIASLIESGDKRLWEK